MKKPILALTAIFAFTAVVAGAVIKCASIKASEIFIPLGTDLQISLLELSNISVKDFEKLTGKHLHLADRLFFQAGQKRLKDSIKRNGAIKNKKFIKFLSEAD